MSLSTSLRIGLFSALIGLTGPMIAGDLNAVDQTLLAAAETAPEARLPTLTQVHQALVAQVRHYVAENQAPPPPALLQRFSLLGLLYALPSSDTRHRALRFNLLLEILNQVAALHSTDPDSQTLYALYDVFRDQAVSEAKHHDDIFIMPDEEGVSLYQVIRTAEGLSIPIRRLAPRVKSTWQVATHDTLSLIGGEDGPGVDLTQERKPLVLILQGGAELSALLEAQRRWLDAVRSDVRLVLYVDPEVSDAVTAALPSAWLEDADAPRVLPALTPPARTLTLVEVASRRPLAQWSLAVLADPQRQAAFVGLLSKALTTLFGEQS